MNVLIACEESQRVCTKFREKGHSAFSCDIEPESGGHPEWHIKQDVIPLLDGKCVFKTEDGKTHWIPNKWDLIIAHPPCTYLTLAGNRWFNEEKYGEEAIKRKAERELAVDFFMKFTSADCEHIAIENPIGVMSTRYKKPTQIIQPYYFGEPYRKSTCLWLKGLEPLEPTEIVEPDVYSYVAKNGRVKTDGRWRSSCGKADRAKIRSKTFWGIASAMADQWGKAEL